MTERAKQSYEGLDAYEAGYRAGYEQGHDDATTISSWCWEYIADETGAGAWACEACGYMNEAIPFDETINPYKWNGSNYCANCGRRMIDMTHEEA